MFRTSSFAFSSGAQYDGPEMDAYDCRFWLTGGYICHAQKIDGFKHVMETGWLMVDRWLVEVKNTKKLDLL